jgi:hypothetical protein
MESAIYLLSGTAALCGIYLVWSLAIRSLLLDITRERLFEQRSALFQLAARGEIDFEDEAYRSLEILYCGLLRFAHRVTFLTFMISSIANRLAEKDKDYVDVSAQLALKVSRLRPETQAKITSILAETRSTMIAYVGLSSIFFITLAVSYLILKVLGIKVLEEAKDNVVVTLEREAYIAEARRGLRLAPA